MWEKWLTRIENKNKERQIKYETLFHLLKALVNYVIVNKLESNLYLRSVHKNCYKMIDRELISKEKRWRLSIKKHLNKVIFKATCEFRDDIKADIEN